MIGVSKLEPFSNLKKVQEVILETGLFEGKSLWHNYPPLLQKQILAEAVHEIPMPTLCSVLQNEHWTIYSEIYSYYNMKF